MRRERGEGGRRGRGKGGGREGRGREERRERYLPCGVAGVTMMRCARTAALSSLLPRVYHLLYLILHSHT